MIKENNQNLEGSLWDPIFLQIRIVMPIIKSDENIGMKITKAIKAPSENPKTYFLTD